MHLRLTLACQLTSIFTQTCLNQFSITRKDILAIIQSLGPNKSYGRDNFSIDMIKMWRDL